jgi:hypothetical protein
MPRQIVSLLGFVVVEICLVLPLTADHKPPVFVFGGTSFYIGMSAREAAVSFSACCKLLPPMESDIESVPAPNDVMGGRFILQKESPQRMLGSVFVSGGKIVRLTRPLGEDVDTHNEEVVGFARALERAISRGSRDSETNATVSLRHERMNNAESDLIVIRLPDGRGIELRVGTLDKPDSTSNKRDFATLDETLEPPR